MQVDRDSVVLDPGLAGSGEQHAPAMMPAPQMPAHMVPVPYMTHGMAAVPPFGRIDPIYGLQRPALWPGPGMAPYAHMFTAGPGQQANLQAAAAAAYQAIASTPSLQPGMPVPALAGHADLPRQPPFSGPPDFPPPLSSQSLTPPQQPPPPPQPPSPAHQGFQARGVGDTGGGETGGNFSPELEQLVRQLALSQLGHPPENP